MAQLLFSKIMQAVLFTVAFISYITVELQQTIQSNITPFEEAAKYGFAVLVLFIVLALLYKDWKQEKDYSKAEIKGLNSVIMEMVEMNRTALERSASAMEKQNEATERLTEIIKDLRSEVKSH